VSYRAHRSSARRAPATSTRAALEHEYYERRERERDELLDRHNARPSQATAERLRELGGLDLDY
jgi:hypothetical protein